MIVTIDGPAGAGKSTVAHRVAHELGLPYLNSGFIYRTLTLTVIEDGGDFQNQVEIVERIEKLDIRFEDESFETADGALHFTTLVYLGDRDVTEAIKSPTVTAEVYQIASVKEYREKLVDLQRRFAEPNGVVTEGRDMGSVIFPDAECKFYLDASAEERARRRHREFSSADDAPSYEDVLRDILIRDQKDRGREHAPLCIPDGAYVLGSDGKTIVEVVGEILRCARNEETLEQS